MKFRTCLEGCCWHGCSGAVARRCSIRACPLGDVLQHHGNSISTAAADSFDGRCSGGLFPDGRCRAGQKQKVRTQVQHLVTCTGFSSKHSSPTVAAPTLLPPPRNISTTRRKPLLPTQTAHNPKLFGGGGPTPLTTTAFQQQRQAGWQPASASLSPAVQGLPGTHGLLGPFAACRAAAASLRLAR